MTIPVLRSRAALRDMVAGWKSEGHSVGVVPTMGALHEGHLSLVRAALADNSRVIVTIFVNPAQFNDPADLAKYPRTEEDDLALLAPFGIAALYAPPVEEIYPQGFATKISVSGISQGLCGDGRPGHFDGVATVVAKLFLQTGATRAYFGEKDYQQLQVVRRMARDLDIGTEVVPCPTVRDPDGLALSSRNRRLTEAGRAAAPAFPAALAEAARAIAAGHPTAPTLDTARAAILTAGFTQVEYLDLRAEDGLRPLATASEPARLFAAAWIDGIRLIDNLPVPRP